MREIKMYSADAIGRRRHLEANEPKSMRSGEAVTSTLGLPQFERLLDSNRAAALLGIHPKTLQKLARAGMVPCHRIGDLWRFRASELDTWLQNGINSKPPLVP
jgi:excisionase family DNA binding protein